MSFAYIDSQGKEVPIPGPDALRLRIELGAITDATQFYDSAADRWAPASEHEIFRQLKRELEHGEADAFVAPPPSTIKAPPFEEPSAEAPGGETADPETPDPETSDSETSHPEAEDREADDPGFATGMDDFVLGESILDMDLTATDPPEDEPATGLAGETAPEPEGTVLDLGADDLTLAPPPEEAEEQAAGEGLAEPSLEALPEPSLEGSADMLPDGVSDAPSDAAQEVSADPDRPQDADPFEFGSSEFGAEDLTLEGAQASLNDVSSEDPSTEGPSAGQWDVSEDLANSTPLPGDELDPVSDFNATRGLELEDDEDVVDVGGGLEVEGSDMTDYDPDLPPSWTDDEPAAEEDEQDFASAELESDSDPEPAERHDPYQRNIRERTTPRAGPPQRTVTPKGAGTGRVVGIAVALLIVLGGGAWFVLQGGGEGRSAAEPTILLPELPADLQPQLRQLAQRASQRMVEAFDSLPERVALPAEPGQEWLSGRYLASASTFPEVESYWTAFGVLLDEIVATDDAVWTAAFEEEVVAANMTVENTEMIRERGMLGWEASAEDRQIVYDQLRRVIDAARDLHRFLVSNEAEIAYTARGAVGGDPFSEIEPSSDALADGVLERVSAIPENLDALGYLQQVETEPLFGAVKEKLVATGIR